MSFEIIDIHSNAKVVGKGYPLQLTVSSQEEISLGPNQVGVLLGKNKHHRSGIFFQGGIINPGWSGYLTIELVIFGEATIEIGEAVAHALIFTDHGMIEELSTEEGIAVGIEENPP